MSARKLTPARLDAMLEEARVDCDTIDEELVGVFTLMEEHLKLPFETRVLGQPVTVKSIDLSAGGDIVAIVARGSATQRIPILDLPLPEVPPEGAEWIAACRRWCKWR